MHYAKLLTLVTVAVLTLSGPSVAQSRSSATTIRPPQPRYEQYGSYSRQLTVYRNTQAQFEADRRREYRLWREEIRRQVARDRAVQPQVRRGATAYTYGDALASWRGRQVVETRTRVVIRRSR